MAHRAGKQEANDETQQDSNYRKKQIFSGHGLTVFTTTLKDCFSCRKASMALLLYILNDRLDLFS